MGQKIVLSQGWPWDATARRVGWVTCVSAVFLLVSAVAPNTGHHASPTPLYTRRSHHR